MCAYTYPAKVVSVFQDALYLDFFTAASQANPDPVSVAYVHDIFKLFQQQLVLFFAPPSSLDEKARHVYAANRVGPVYVSMAKSKTEQKSVQIGMTKKTMSMQKCCAHGTWPDLIVHKERALTIRETWIGALELKYANAPRKEPSNTWEMVVDEQVYTKNGLRMLGSRKAGLCPICRGKKEYKDKDGDACSECCNGKVDLDRSYSMSTVLDGFGNVDEERLQMCQGNIRLAIESTSIRAWEPQKNQLTPGFQPFQGAPRPSASAFRALTQAQAKASLTAAAAVRRPQKELDEKDLQQYLETREEEEERKEEIALNPTGAAAHQHALATQPAKTDMIRIHPSDPRVACLMQNIRSQMDNLWEEIVPASLYQQKNQRYYKLYVKGKGSNYCQNVARDHGGAKIYFYVTAKGISQKCMSQKPMDAERRYGRCKDFESPATPLSMESRQILFPKMKTTGKGRGGCDYATNDDSELVRAIDYTQFRIQHRISQLRHADEEETVGEENKRKGAGKKKRARPKSSRIDAF